MKRRKYLWIRKIKPRGFSLIELMAVMIIMGLLGGTVTVAINSQVKKSRIQAAKTQISTLEQGMNMFNLECGFYPSTLDSLISPPTSGRECKGYPPDGFLQKKQIPKDPWKNDYNFASPGIHNTSTFDIWSNGPDGEDGTEDDIVSWVSETSETDRED